MMPPELDMKIQMKKCLGQELKMVTGKKVGGKPGLGATGVRAAIGFQFGVDSGNGSGWSSMLRCRSRWSIY